MRPPGEAQVDFGYTLVVSHSHRMAPKPSLRSDPTDPTK